MKTWVKLYTETNEDPKIGSLTWAQRGIWAALLALAGRLDYRDDDGIEVGLLDTIESTAWHLRCSVEELQEAVEAFQEQGMIDERDGLLYITNYTKRQRRAPSASREAVAERVKRHRDATSQQGNDEPGECNEDVTTLQNNVTPLDTETEESRKEEKREDCAASAAKPSAPPPEPPPKQSKPPTPAQEMFSAVAELCQIDLSLLSKKDRGKINTVSKRLRDEKKSTAHLDQFKRYWYAVDWRGVKGQAPAPHDILSSWGRAKEWLANGGKGKDAKRNDRRAKPVDTGQAAKRQIEAEQSAHVGRVLAERAQAAGLAV